MGVLTLQIPCSECSQRRRQLCGMYTKTRNHLLSQFEYTFPQKYCEPQEKENCGYKRAFSCLPTFSPTASEKKGAQHEVGRRTRSATSRLPCAPFWRRSFATGSRPSLHPHIYVNTCHS